MNLRQFFRRMLRLLPCSEGSEKFCESRKAIRLCSRRIIRLNFNFWATCQKTNSFCFSTPLPTCLSLCMCVACMASISSTQRSASTLQLLPVYARLFFLHATPPPLSTVSQTPGLGSLFELSISTLQATRVKNAQNWTIIYISTWAWWWDYFENLGFDLHRVFSWSSVYLGIARGSQWLLPLPHRWPSPRSQRLWPIYCIVTKQAVKFQWSTWTGVSWPFSDCISGPAKWNSLLKQTVWGQGWPTGGRGGGTFSETNLICTFISRVLVTIHSMPTLFSGKRQSPFVTLQMNTKPMPLSLSQWQKLNHNETRPKQKQLSHTVCVMW